VSTSPVHPTVAQQLERAGQRYTAGRRALVEALANAGRPVSLPELLELVPGTPQSSAYRNLAVLTESGAVQRLPSTDEFGRFELAEALTGHHHHHVQCTNCGAVVDVELSRQIETVLRRTEAELASQTGFVITSHMVAFEGLCTSCDQTTA
jgi:Fur family transcriptional regulator, ferric uptake regulator